MSSDRAWLLAALQYGDSAYPTGGFAYSWGLETAVAEGHVSDADGLIETCRNFLAHQVGSTDAVAAAACSVAAVRGDTDRFVAIDRRLTATKPAREAREGSTRIGRRLLDTTVRAERLPWLEHLRGEVLAGVTPGNQASVLGAVAGLLGAPPEQAAALLLWTAAGGFLNAGLRLLRITHDDVQAGLVWLRPLISRLAAEAAGAEPLEIAGTAPLLEIWLMRHEVATTRLFAS